MDETLYGRFCCPLLVGGFRGERQRSPRVQVGHAVARAEPSERQRVEAERSAQGHAGF
jgi:hypothetical protein